jgi:hypothetical protein
MARVLERDTERERLPRRPFRRVGEQLRDVDDVRADVILQMGTATRCIGHDRVVAAEVALQLPCTCDSVVDPTGVRMERAAAALSPGYVHVVAVRCEDACSRAVHMPEDDALHAAHDHGDAWPAAGDPLRRPLVVEPRRRDPPERGERPGCRQLAERQRHPQSPAMREDREDQRAQ